MYGWERTSSSEPEHARTKIFVLELFGKKVRTSSNSCAPHNTRQTLKSSSEYARLLAFARVRSSIEALLASKMSKKPYCSSRSANVRRVFAEHGRAGGAKFEHARELFGRKFLCSNSCSASMLGEYSAFLRSNSCSFPTLSHYTQDSPFRFLTSIDL